MAAPAAATVIEREPTSNMTHEALHQVYQENLEPDFSPYKHTSYDLMGLQTMMQEILSGRPPKHMSLIVIKDNAVHAIPLIKVQPQLTVKRVGLSRGNSIPTDKDEFPLISLGGIYCGGIDKCHE